MCFATLSSSLCLSVFTLVGGDEKVTVKTELIKPTPGKAAQPMVNSGRKQLTFGDQLPAGVKAPPMSHGSYAVIELGGKKIAFAIDMAPEAKDAMVGIDADGNGEITGAEVKKMEVTTQERGQGNRTTKVTTLAQNEAIKLPGGELLLNLMVNRDKVTGGLVSPGYRKGTVKIGGTDYVLVVTDTDLDGTHGSKGDFFAFMSAEDFGKVRQLGDRNGRMFECNEYAIVGEQRAWLTPGPDGTFAVTLGAAKEPLGDYLHRRTERVNKDWWESFAPTADQFNQQQKIDTARPKAKTPVHWLHTLDLAPVLAQAKKENKPVLIDFETDWCVWCKRFDFFTYPYADVADELGKFITVKFNCELDTKDLVKSYGVTGFPSLAVLTPDGKALMFEGRNGPGKTKSGFLPPAKMVPFLKECLARVAKGEVDAPQKAGAGDDETKGKGGN